MRDSIVDEVRQARDEYARRFQYDVEAMCADLRAKQGHSGAVVASFPAKPSAAPPTARPGAGKAGACELS